MIQPFDYSIDVQQPFQAVAQGYQLGSAIHADQLQQAALQQQLQAKQAQQQRAQQMQADLAEISRNPTPGAIAQLSAKYPEMSEQFKRSFDMMSTEQQKNDVQHMSMVYSAVNSGRQDIAAKLLRERAEALRNSGGDDAHVKAAETMASWVEEHPDSFKVASGTMLAAAMGADKFADAFAKLGEGRRADERQPDEVRKGKAEATTAEVKAKYADSDALLELEKKGWDIKGIQADIEFKKQSTRIAAMNASLAREGNDLRREELRLKIDDAKRERDEKVREKVAGAESAATAIDNSLNTIERIKTNKKLNNVLGAIEGRMPAMFSDEEADAVALIETLGSQAFLAQIPAMKGQGALSNAEGEKLQSALTNLSRKQSEGQFRANLDEAARLMKKARETLSKRTGVPLAPPDTPAAPGARPPLSSFQKG